MKTKIKCKYCERILVDSRSKCCRRCAKMGDRNPQWKGNKVGLISLHEWIISRKPKTQLCENCKKVTPKDLANISGKYKRDVNDFKWLCRSCHMKEDGRLNRLILKSAEKSKRKHQGDLLYCNKCKTFIKKEDFTKNKAISDSYELFCRHCLSKITKIKYQRRIKKCQIRQEMK